MDSLIICSKMTGLKRVIVMVASMEVITREMGKVLLEIEDKVEEILEVFYVVKVGEEVDLTKVQMSDIQE